jgi:predicted dehydrogenase
MSHLKWAIMGLGEIANEFASSMNQVNEIYAVASRDQEKVNTFKKQHQVNKAYTSYEELLLDEEVDIVYIATVNSQHYKNIIDCLNHNKHVFCEKAIWRDEQELKKAYELAKSKNLFLGEAMTIYYMPLYKKIKEIINEGILGKIKLVQANFGILKEPDPTNRFFSKELGGGAMLDIGTYALTFVHTFLSSPPSEINNVINKFETGVDESWGINLKNHHNEIGNVNLTLRAKLPKQGIIAGDKAYIIVNEYPRADEAVLLFPDGNKEVIKAGSTDKAFLYEIMGVEEAISTKDYAIGCFDTTYSVVSIMDRLMTKAGV